MGSQIQRMDTASSALDGGDTGIEIDTWGMLGTITYLAIAKYAAKSTDGELYVILTTAQVAKGASKCPNGFEWGQLIKDFNAIGGNVPVPVAPPPAATTHTLAEAQSILASGWMSKSGQLGQ